MIVELTWDMMDLVKRTTINQQLTWDLIVEDLQPWQSGASVDSISGDSEVFSTAL